MSSQAALNICFNGHHEIVPYLNNNILNLEKFQKNQSFQASLELKNLIVLPATDFTRENLSSYAVGLANYGQGVIIMGNRNKYSINIEYIQKHCNNSIIEDTVEQIKQTIFPPVTIILEAIQITDEPNLLCYRIWVQTKKSEQQKVRIHFLRRKKTVSWKLVFKRKPYQILSTNASVKQLTAEQVLQEMASTFNKELNLKLKLKPKVKYISSQAQQQSKKLPLNNNHTIFILNNPKKTKLLEKIIQNLKNNRGYKSIFFVSMFQNLVNPKNYRSMLVVSHSCTNLQLKIALHLYKLEDKNIQVLYINQPSTYFAINAHISQQLKQSIIGSYQQSFPKSSLNLSEANQHLVFSLGSQLQRIFIVYLLEYYAVDYTFARSIDKFN